MVRESKKDTLNERGTERSCEADHEDDPSRTFAGCGGDKANSMNTTEAAKITSTLKMVSHRENGVPLREYQAAKASAAHKDTNATQW